MAKEKKIKTIVANLGLALANATNKTQCEAAKQN